MIIRSESPLQGPESGNHLLDVGQQVAVALFRVAENAAHLASASLMSGTELIELGSSEVGILPFRDPVDGLDGAAEFGRENLAGNECGAISRALEGEHFGRVVISRFPGEFREAAAHEAVG